MFKNRGFKQNIIPLINEFTNANVDVIDIICNEVDNNLNSKIFLDKTMIFTNKKKLYLNYFLKHNLFPDATNLNLKSNKLKFADIVKNMFIPQKAKSYFFCGLILIFSSIILPYHFYYVVVGSTLLMFGIICKLLPRFKD